MENKKFRVTGDLFRAEYEKQVKIAIEKYKDTIAEEDEK